MRKGSRVTVAILVLFVSCWLWSGVSEATLQSQQLFKQTYPGKTATYYNCAICHSGKIGKKGELNPYGQSLKLVPPAKLTVEQLKAAESLDPDGDGVPSGKEIEAGTLPGDPASHP